MSPSSKGVIMRKSENLILSRYQAPNPEFETGIGLRLN